MSLNKRTKPNKKEILKSRKKRNGGDENTSH